MANANANYMRSMARLEESLQGNFDGDFLGFVGEHTIDAPLHTDNPYAFKVYAFMAAVDAGYDQIMWMDSACYAIKNVNPIFNVIAKEGYFMQEAGHWAGTWTNDRTLDYFGITRDEAMQIPMFTAGFFGLKMADKIASEFFSKWFDAMKAGMFKGNWTNWDHSESNDARCEGSRHDMSCASIITHQLGMKYKAGNEWLQYAGPNDAPNNDNIICKIQGM